MEDIQNEITDLATIEPLAKSIETIKNISIEHAYSEEIDSNDKQENSHDTTPLFDTSASEYQEEESSVQSDEQLSTPTPTPTPQTPTIETKPELTLEQVAEKVKSRELKSLLEAAKESNLDTNIIHKRESRKSLDPYGSKTPTENHESSGKRTMRSQNPDFLVKQQKFLHKVTKFEGSSDNLLQDTDFVTPKKEKDSSGTPKSLKRKKDDNSMDSDDNKKNRKAFKMDVVNTIKNGKDSFCWRCHRDGVMVHCETCPRAYHIRCLKQPVTNPDRWPCPECLAILQAESTKTRSPAMREMSLEHLCELLKYAVKRMIGCAGSEPFIHPVDLKIFPDYRNYVVQPMDLTTLENNIRNNLYGSTVAFMADAKWILHNSIIYNSYQSKLTSAAKSITKICKQEMSEIETCSECYQNANTKKNSWFVEVCPKPHILLWAKLKGFPYWPAKAMTTNSAGLVDVRFFGAHDRAWIPVKECFLYSKKDPNTTNKNKRNNIAECIKEVDIHVEKLKEAFGEFCHAPYRTPYNPNAESEQLKFMLPRYRVGLKLKSPAPSTLKNANANANANANSKENEERNDKEKFKAKVYKSNSRESLDSRDDSFQKNSDSTESINDISDSRIRSDLSEDTDLLSSTSSKTSLLLVNDEENNKQLALDKDKDAKFSTQDFDKFMEGYGTEDDEATALTLNDEIRKKMVQYESDSEGESSTAKDQEDTKEMENGGTAGSSGGSTSSVCTSPEKAAEITSKLSGAILTPESYSKMSGKLRIIRSKRPVDTTARKRNLSSTQSETDSPNKMQRRNSDISTTSDSSRISGLSDKISRVEEFSDTLEVSLANTSKDSAVISFSENISPEKKSSLESSATEQESDQADLNNLKPVIQVCTGDLFNKNKDLKISPQSKSSVSIADRLMKKITGTGAGVGAVEVSNEIDKVEAVKKQILENLETTNSNSPETQTNDLVSSSNANTNIDKEQSVNDTQEQETDEDTVIDKNSPSVSSSTESLQTDSDATNKTEAKTLRPRKTKETKTNMDISDESDSNADDDDENEDEDEDSESEQSVIGEKNVDKSHVKLVNVSDILSGKINGNASLEAIMKSKNKTNTTVTTTTTTTTTTLTTSSSSVTTSTTTKVTSGNSNKELLTNNVNKCQDEVEVKNEPLSDDETSKTVSSDDETLDKLLDADADADGDGDETRPFKVVDNLTRIIDSVATDYNSPLSVNKKELSLRPISKLIHSPKQRARKSFPNSPHTMNHISLVTSSMKKILPDKKPIQQQQQLQLNTSMKVVSTLQNIQPHVVATSSVPTSSGSGNGSGNKEGMIYITSQQSPVVNNMGLLPPNQPITLTSQNVGNSILTMVQHHGIPTPSLIIQQNPTLPTAGSVSQCPIVAPVAITTSSTVTSVQTATTPPSITTNVLTVPQLPDQASNSIHITEDRSAISEQISKAVGDLFCRPPPVLKPRPPGPLSTFFDEGLPSSTGPTTKLVNSISHRLSDYFRGLLCESLHDLSTIGSPEAKIRSLELEIESLKCKHKEEMAELRKNISSVLKDIQKSIIEDKAKIVDETRSACEAERLRCIEETKSKQWCAFCLKEAQFYCCWNTSYCDYPCQQKHWPAHMNTCSQARNAASGGPNANTTEKTQINTASKLTKAVPSNKTMIKPARMIVKQTSKGVPMYVPVQRSLQAGQQTLTLVESTPGNFEIVGNHGPISLGGKIVPTTTIKVKPGNVITVAPSSSNSTALSTAGTSKTIILSQKAPQIIHKSSNENKT